MLDNSHPMLSTDPEAAMRRILLAVAVSFLLILLGVGGLALSSLRGLTRDAASVRRAQEVKTLVSELMGALTDVETSVRGHLLTGQADFLEPYHQARGQISALAESVQARVLDDSVNLALTDMILLAQSRQEVAEDVLTTFQERGFVQAQALVASGTGMELHDRLRGHEAWIMERQNQILRDREDRTARTARRTMVLLALGVATGMAVLALGTMVLYRGLGERAAARRALQTSNSLMEAILAGTDYAIISGDEGGIRLFNRGAEKLLGYEAGDVVGKATADLFHDPDEMATAAQALTQELGEEIKPGLEVFLARSRRGATDIGEWTYVRKDGRRVPVLLAVSPLRDENGRVVSFLGIAQDNSARKEAERSLVASREAMALAKHRAEEADRAKSVFLATMSHELRTPLNSIIGFTGVLQQGLAGPLTDEQQRQLEMVRGSGRHLLALINDILDISRIEAGELSLQARPMEVPDSLRRVASTLGPLASAKGLQLDLSMPPDLGRIRQDERRLEQILINLIGNAIKFTEKGGVKVQAVRRAGWLCVQVQDTGPGMDAEELEQLFRPFHQLDNGLARSHEGTGLGLAISQRLAALMGGSITVHSTPGLGSTFTLNVPLEEETVS
jgi:PAS domain S-box-containing protein